ncbi:MAG: CCA tRNA nucleotidyltransferase [Verrucomicrobiae bacterium]|nr:CCA tRNA nucleotidyltransferase [Verrucomicrobiae bacterium]
MHSSLSTAIKVVRALQARGHEALLAGGCVRDRLLRRRPQDYDVATSAHPGEVERIFPRTVAVGKAFGVIRVLVDDEEIEVATFRSESGYVDGRRPGRVSFTDAREDALRRDFTVNGLFYDPLRRRILDYVGGRTDLRRQCLRAIGRPEERFGEDRLRLLRCVRFAAQLGFRIDPATWRAVCKEAPAIRRVSFERIRDELTKLLLAPHAAEGLRLLWRSGLLRHLLPEVDAMAGVRQPRAYHPEGDVWKHTRLVVAHLRKPSPRLAWAALLHDVGKPPMAEKSVARGRWRLRFPNHAGCGGEMADRILLRLRFSTADREAIVAMVKNHMTFKDCQAMRLATLKRLLARPTFEEELRLHRADCLASHGSESHVRYLRRRQKELSAAGIRPPRLLNGRDLIELGLQPGPVFGQILAAIEEAQLEGRVSTRGQALDEARKQAAERKMTLKK